MTLVGTQISKPVRVSDIKNCIGVASGQVSVLNTSGNINPKAKYKPVNLNTTSEIAQDTDRRPINYGHTYSYNFGSMLTMLQTYANQDYFFPYVRPSSKYRIVDWNGYDHASGNWFSSAAQNATLPSTSTAPFRILLDYAGLATYISSVNAAMFNSLDFGFFVLTAMPTTGMTESIITGFYKVTNIAGGTTLPDLIDQYDGKIPIFPSRLGAATYYIIPCFTTYTATGYGAGSLIPRSTMQSISWESYNWYLYPFCTIGQITVTSGGGGGEQERLANIVFDTEIIETEPRDYLSYRIVNFVVSITNDNNSSVNLTLNSVVVDNAVSGATLATNLTTTLSAGQTRTLTIVSSGDPKDFVLASSETGFTINYKLTGGSATANALLTYDPTK